MFSKLLIANRGEIAVRIMRTAKAMGIRTVAIYSDADRHAMHTALADEAFHIGAAPASQSYLNQDAIIHVAKTCDAEAVHPGYGFLSENPDFAQKVSEAELVFVGPPASAIRALGLKDEAKRLMQQAGVSLLPGYHGENQDDAQLTAEALRIGLPVLIKPVAGGGGKGMQLVEREGDFAGQLEMARREARSSFGDDRVLLEKFLPMARHIEIQIMADRHDNIIHLFERDCSLQRRHQKVVEESPAPGMMPQLRKTMCAEAVAAARQVGFVGAGTVEFIADVSEGLRVDRYYFLEMNTRLQVEHPVTEVITGLDLVELQLRVASGEALLLRQEDVTMTGHAVEVRLYAEDPAKDFQPQTGKLSHLEFPSLPGLRADMGVRAGDSVTSFYDPMIGKLIMHAPSRKEAIEKMGQVLSETRIGGCRTNISFLSRLMRLQEFASANLNTGSIGQSMDALISGTEPPLEAVAAALLLSSGYLTLPPSLSPFDTLIGFRLWGGEPITIALDHHGQRLNPRLEQQGNRFVVSLDKRTLDFSIVDHDHANLRLDCSGQILRLSHFKYDGGIDIVVSGERHEFRPVKYNASEVASEGSQLVVSPVPGLITQLLVSKGQAVQRGDTIAVLEAMKMEFRILAERDGPVREVHVSDGNQITEGTLIAEIGEADG